MKAGRKRKVLVVEDNLLNLMLLTEVLTLHDFEVVEALDGEEGLAVALEQRPDLILMDINLPGIDGFETARLIREQDELKGIPIVAITASAMLDNQKKIKSEGFNGYVPKPVDMNKLFEVISTVFKQDCF